MSNAIKYTPPGGWVRVGFERPEHDAGSGWTLSVEDTGVGITPEELGAIFEEFHRLPATAHLRGTGLGLATTRQLVEQMGGRIEVRSRPGEGSCFRVSLPGTSSTSKGAQRR